MASVRKRHWTHKGVEREAWVCTYTESGQRRQKTFEKKKDADRFRQKVEAELLDGSHVAARDKVTVAEAVTAFLADCDRRNKIGDRMAGNTLANYVLFCGKLRDEFGKRPIADIQRTELQDWIDRLSLICKPRTLGSLNISLRGVFKLALRKGWIKRNVLADDPLRLPSNDGRRVRIPTREDIAVLYRFGTMPSIDRADRGHLKGHLTKQALVMMGIFCGLRRGEMAGLQWDNIDFQAMTIKVCGSLSIRDGLKSPKTKAGIRTVPMSEPVADALRRLRDYWLLRQEVYENRRPNASRKSVNERLVIRYDRGDKAKADAAPLEGFVLRSTPPKTKGEKLTREWGYGRHYDVGSFTANMWPDLMKHIGLLDGKRPRFSMHAMRHAAASLLIEAGLPAMNLAAVIGHSSVTTTYNVYGHLFPDDTRAAVALNSIASAFQAAREQQGQLTD